MASAPPPSRREWYAPDPADASGGDPALSTIRFECTQCGACCTGPEGYVGVTDEEVAAIARLRNMPVADFRAKYTRMTDDGRSLTEVRTVHGFDCVFLDRDSIPGKAVCTIYQARPLQCRTFPWWPGVIKSSASWQRLGRECEGVGRGGFVPVEEIRINRDLQAKSDGGVSR
mgnify:CR=1 FL=1